MVQNQLMEEKGMSGAGNQKKKKKGGKALELEKAILSNSINGRVVLLKNLGLMRPDSLEKRIEEILRVPWTSLEFGMELNRGDGFGLMEKTFVGSIVEISEVRRPAGGKGLLANFITMVLGGDDPLPRSKVNGGLVVAAVAMLQLAGGGASRVGEEEISHADTKDGGDSGLVNEVAEVLDGRAALAGIAGTVGEEESIKRGLAEIVVPGEEMHLGTSCSQRADDVVLHSIVQESYHNITSLIEDLHVLRRYLSDQVAGVGIDKLGKRQILGMRDAALA